MASAAGFAQLLKDVAKPALTSGGLATAMSLLGGANPLQALASGAVDATADVVTLGALRKLSPGSYRKRTVIDKDTGKTSVVQDTHSLEVPLNIAASIGASYVADPLIYGAGQQKQMAQQVEQRALINGLQTPQLLSPNTNFQLNGLPDPQNFQQLLNQKNNSAQYLSPEDQLLLQQAQRPVL
jgi:hypothetical protein